MEFVTSLCKFVSSGPFARGGVGLLPCGDCKCKIPGAGPTRDRIMSARPVRPEEVRKTSGRKEEEKRGRSRVVGRQRAAGWWRPYITQLTYGGYFLGFLYMQILHYNNDFEIDKMCLRNWCALENSYTFAFLPKSNLEIETHTQTLFSIVTHFPPLFHN